MMVPFGCVTNPYVIDKWWNSETNRRKKTIVLGLPGTKKKRRQLKPFQRSLTNKIDVFFPDGGSYLKHPDMSETNPGLRVPTILLWGPGIFRPSKPTNFGEGYGSLGKMGDPEVEKAPPYIPYTCWAIGAHDQAFGGDPWPVIGLSWPRQGSSAVWTFRVLIGVAYSEWPEEPRHVSIFFWNTRARQPRIRDAGLRQSMPSLEQSMSLRSILHHAGATILAWKWTTLILDETLCWFQVATWVSTSILGDEQGGPLLAIKGVLTSATHLFSAIYRGPVAPFQTIGSGPTLKAYWDTSKLGR